MEEEFQRLFVAYNRHVLAYALRRTGQRSDAEDVVSSTFTVAWRRFGDKPSAEFELPWLYAIAARVLANQRRSLRRLAALRSRLRELPAPAGAERSDLPEVVAALKQLHRDDQEILRLAAWEGLTGAELAVALECTENAAAIRLHRARKRLEELMVKEASAVGQTLSE